MFFWSALGSKGLMKAPDAAKKKSHAKDIPKGLEHTEWRSPIKQCKKSINSWKFVKNLNFRKTSDLANPGAKDVRGAK